MPWTFYMWQVSALFSAAPVRSEAVKNSGMTRPDVGAALCGCRRVSSRRRAQPICTRLSTAIDSAGQKPGGEWSNPGGVCVPGTPGMTEYTGKPRSHTVQNVGTGEYHLTLVENLRNSGWTSYDALSVAGLKMIRENRAFRIYEVHAGGPVHTHQVPTVAIVVTGEAIAGDKRLDKPGQSAFIPAGKDHRIVAQGEARVFEIEVR